MAGHKTCNRFNNSRVYWNQNGQAVRREQEEYFHVQPKSTVVSSLRKDALEAAKRYTQEVSINRIAFNWPK